MTKLIILILLYFMITGLIIYLQVVNFDFNKLTEEDREQVEDLLAQIYTEVHCTRDQAMQITGILGFLLGWFIVPTAIVKRIWKFLTKGLTKSK